MRKRILLFVGLLVMVLVLVAASQSSFAVNTTPYAREIHPTWVPFRAYPVDVPETVPPGDWAVPVEAYLRHKDPVTAGSTWISPIDEDRWTARGMLPVFEVAGE